ARLEAGTGDLEPITLLADHRQRKAGIDPQQDLAADSRLADERRAVLQHEDVGGGARRSHRQNSDKRNDRQNDDSQQPPAALRNRCSGRFSPSHHSASAPAPPDRRSPWGAPALRRPAVPRDSLRWIAGLLCLGATRNKDRITA